MRFLLPLAFSAAAALAIGPAGLDPAVLGLRLPRVFGALVGGAGLGLAGLSMQALLRNALADPFVLGMSGGAALGAVAAILVLPAFPVPVAAAAGALLTALLVAGVARGPDGLYPPTRLLLAGIAVSATAGAAATFLVQVAPDTRNVRAALYWLTGGLGGVRWPAIGLAAAAALAGWAVLRARAGDLDRLLLGEITAASLGVDVPRTRALLLGLGSVLTGVTVALGGPLAFVGLAAPHFGRLLGGATHRGLVSRTALLGAGLLLWSDTAARAAFAPREIPTGVLTAVLGGPFFLWLLRRGGYAFGEAA